MALVDSGRIAAVCTALVGVLTIAFAATNFLLPAGIYDTEKVLFAAGSNPNVYRFFFAEWAATGLLGLAIVEPVTTLITRAGDGWAAWASKLGYLAYGLTAVQAIHVMNSLPGLGELYQGCHTCTANLATQQTIAKWIYVNLALDPMNLIVVGGLALWILAINLQGWIVRDNPRALLAVGIAAAGLLLVVVVAGALNLPLDLPVLLATIASAAWYAWVALHLWRHTRPGPPSSA